MDAVAARVQALLATGYAPVPLMGDDGGFEQLALSRISWPHVVDVVQFRPGFEHPFLATRFGLVHPRDLIDPTKPWPVLDHVVDPDPIILLDDVMGWPRSPASGPPTQRRD
jgi:hypothetical protein